MSALATIEVSSRRRTPVRSRAVKTVRVGLLGYGRIGEAVAALASRESARLASAGLQIDCTSALVRDVAKPRGGPRLELTSDPGVVFDSGIDLLVEVLGGTEPARALITRALESGIPVVTANKTVMAHHGQALRSLAWRQGVPLAFEASVLAGVPCLGALARRPVVRSAHGIEGLINGTSHVISTAIESGETFDAALADAMVRGFAEPDPSADIEGRDAAEKLTVLLHLCGKSQARVGDLPRTPLAALQPVDFLLARRLGGTIKPVAVASWASPEAAGAWVGPAFVDAKHPFATLSGVTNAIRLTGPSGRDLLFVGPGAGPEATASTILDDIVEVASGVPADLPAPAASSEGTNHIQRFASPAASAWYLRLQDASSCDAAGLAQTLVARGATALQVASEGRTLAAVTTPTTWPVVERIVRTLERRGERVQAWPALGR